MASNSRNWFERMFKAQNRKKAPIRNDATRNPRLSIEALEDRVVPATSIVVIPGASGTGDLDAALLGDATVTTAEVTAATLGTLSQGALQAIAGNTDLSVTSPTGITFRADLTTPIQLQTAATKNATFTAIAGDITFQDTPDALRTNAGNLFLTAMAANTNLTLGSLSSNGGTISLTADGMGLNAPINAGTGSVLLANATAARVINIGTDTAGQLSLTNAELNQITASIVKVGSNTAASGAISITTPISLITGFTSLSLQSGTTISDGGANPLVVNSLALRATGAITLTNAATDIESLAVSAASLTLVDTDSILIASITDQVGNLPGINVTGAVSLTAGTTVSQAAGANVVANTLSLNGTAIYNLPNTGNDVNTITANIAGGPTRTVLFTDANNLTTGTITTTGGNVTLTSAAGGTGDLVVNAALTTGGATGSAFLTAAGTNNLLNINAAVSAVDGVVFTADRMTIGAAVTANNANRTSVLRNSSLNRPIDLGGADTATTLGLSSTEINNVTVNAATGVLVVGRNDANASGDITFTTATLTTTGTNQLELVTGGAINDNFVGLDVVVTRLGLTAVTGVGGTGSPLGAIDTQVSRLEATTVTGGVGINNTTTTLTIGGVNGTLNGVQITGTTPASNITITNDTDITIGLTAGEGISNASGGNIAVSNTAGSISVNAAVAAVGTGAGTVSILATDSLTVTAPVSSGTGTISLRSDNNNDGTGNFSSSATGTVSTLGGAVGIAGSPTNNGGMVTVGGPVTVTGSPGGVTITNAGNVTVNASVSVTGSGNIIVTADQNTDGTGNFMSAATGSLMTTIGAITVTGNNITTGGMISSTGGGNITLNNTASNANGTINVNAPVLASGGNGNITVTSDDDGNITAAVSAAGNGNIAVTADLNGNSSGNLSTSGAITAVNGTIMLTAEDDVMLGAAVSTTGTSGGNITITADPTPDDGNFSSNTPGTISTTVGSVTISAADDISVGGAISVGGTGTLTLSADTPNGGVGDVLVGAAVTTAGGNVTITAQDTDITGTITTPAANRVILLARDAADVITLGTDTAGALGLTNADLNNITTGTLKIGSGTQTGNISFTAPITLTVAKVPVLSLETTGGILDNVAGESSFLTVRDLAIRAGTGIGSADNLNLTVTNLAASNTTSGNILIGNTGLATPFVLTIAGGAAGANAIDNLSGITETVASGDIFVSNVGGLTIDANVTSNGGGDNDITLTTTSSPGGVSAPILKTANSSITANGGGSGDILLDASSATVGGSITLVDTLPTGTNNIVATGTGDVTLLANDGVSLNDSADTVGVSIVTNTGTISITANSTDPNGQDNVYLGVNSRLLTAGGNVIVVADEGNGIGGMITMADGSSIVGTANTTLTAAKDIRVTSIAATNNIVVTVTGNLGNIIDDNIENTVLVAGNDVRLTSGGRIGGQTPLTTADVESAAATPTPGYLALVDVNYGSNLVLRQVGGQGNIQIRRVGGGINTSSIDGETLSLVGTGNQLALVATGGNFTVDDNFNFNGANNSDLFFATTAGNNVVITAGSSLVNSGATATTSLMASGSATAFIQGPAVADNTSDVTVANLRLFTTGGLIGTSAASPLEINAVTIGGFTNGRANGTTPTTGGDAFLTDTLNGIAVAQFNAGTTGDVTLVSRGLIQTGLGTGSSIVAIVANDNIAEIIGDVVTLTSVATATGTVGQIGSSPGIFFEVDANTLNAATNNSNLWLSAVGTNKTTNVGTINIGTAAGTTAFLRVANGTTLTSGTVDSVADVLAPTVNLSNTATGGGGNFGTSTTAPLEIDAATLVANLQGGGNIFVRDTANLGVVVQRASTTTGNIGIQTTGALGTLTLGNAMSVGPAAVSTGGTTAANATVTLQSALSIVTGAGNPVSDVAGLVLVATANGVGTVGAGAIETVLGTTTTPGQLTVNNGLGQVAVNNNNPGAALVLNNVTHSGEIVITTVDTAAPGENLTVNTGATVSSTLANVTLTAADNLILNGAVTATSGVLPTAAVNLTAGAALTTNAGGTVTANGLASLTANNGAVAIGANVTAGSVTATATDLPTAGQDVTVAAAAVVSATAGGNVTLRAGDNVTVSGTVTTTGAGVTALVGDFNDMDPLVGTTINTGTATLNSAQPVQLTGGTQADTFSVKPQTTTVQTVAGNTPTTLPGDVLNVVGDLGTTLALTGVGNGGFTFTNGAAVNFSNIEFLNPTSAVALVINLATLGFQNGSANPDVVNISTTAGGVLNVTVQDNSTGTPVSVFSGAATDVSSLSLVGSTDRETVNVDETNPGIPNSNLQGGAPTVLPGDALNLVNATGFTFTPAAGGGTFNFPAPNAHAITINGFEVFAPATVSVAVTDNTAAETGSNQTANNGRFTFTRSGDLSAPLTVNITLGGTAVNGKDYQLVTPNNSITFAAGSTTAVLDIIALNNSIVDGTRTVTVALAVGAGYNFTPAPAVTVSIADNDSVVRRVAFGTSIAGAVMVFDNANPTPTFSFFPYPGYTGGVSVAIGDVNGDGVFDIVTGATQFSSHVKVFDGTTGAEIGSFFAFQGFNNGVGVAVGDLDGDGRGEIIVGAQSAAPHVKAFDFATGAERASFFAFPTATQIGVNVASGDLDGDGKAEIIVGARGLQPHVKTFDILGNLTRSFLVQGYNGGISVGAGDLDGDRVAEILVGGTVGNQGFVTVLNGNTAVRAQLPQNTFGQPQVGSADTDGNGAEELFIGLGPTVNALNGQTFTQFATLTPFIGFRGSVFVG